MRAEGQRHKWEPGCGILELECGILELGCGILELECGKLVWEHGMQAQGCDRQV